MYDESGSVVTDVLYDEYKEFNGVLFPTNHTDLAAAGGILHQA